MARPKPPAPSGAESRKAAAGSTDRRKTREINRDSAKPDSKPIPANAKDEAAASGHGQKAPALEPEAMRQNKRAQISAPLSAQDSRPRPIKSGKPPRPAAAARPKPAPPETPAVDSMRAALRENEKPRHRIDDQAAPDALAGEAAIGLEQAIAPMFTFGLRCQSLMIDLFCAQADANAKTLEAMLTSPTPAGAIEAQIDFMRQTAERAFQHGLAAARLMADAGVAMQPDPR